MDYSGRPAHRRNPFDRLLPAEHRRNLARRPVHGGRPIVDFQGTGVDLGNAGIVVSEKKCHASFQKTRDTDCRRLA